MAEKIISRDNFIATMGYDGGTAVVNKTEVSKLKGKSFDEILATRNFRLAAACAIYDDDESEKQKVVDAYNGACDGKYTVSSLPKLFGISEPRMRKVLPL